MIKTAIPRYEPLDRTPPGDTLADTLEEKGMSQTELADRLGLSRKHVNEIIQGKAPISADTALKLETVLGTPAAFWLNLDRHYQEFLARQAEQKSFASQLAWLNRIPLKEMLKLRWIPPFEDQAAALKVALSFFGTASPSLWEDYWTKKAIRFRRSQIATADLGIIASWLRRGELDAQKIETAPFNAEQFRAALEEIRALTPEPPEKFQSVMRDRCAAAGVAVVFTPELRNLRVSGATQWLTPTKALIQLSLRFKSDDHLWFTFFHEAKHVLQEVKKEIFMEGVNGDDPAEKEANCFAADHLVPPSQYREFVRGGTFNETAVTSFARRLKIAPGIVVGRLQHDKHIEFNRLNHLKRRFVWAEQE